MQTPGSPELNSRPLPNLATYPQFPSLQGNSFFRTLWDKMVYNDGLLQDVAPPDNGTPDYDAWVAMQAEVDLRKPEEMAAIKGSIVPLLETSTGDCSVCIEASTTLLCLPCGDQYCEGCLLKSWQSVGKLLCPGCRCDVQARLAGMWGQEAPASSDQCNDADGDAHVDMESLLSLGPMLGNSPCSSTLHTTTRTSDLCLQSNLLRKRMRKKTTAGSCATQPSAIGTTKTDTEDVLCERVKHIIPALLRTTDVDVVTIGSFRKAIEKELSLEAGALDFMKEY